MALKFTNAAYNYNETKVEYKIPPCLNVTKSVKT